MDALDGNAIGGLLIDVFGTEMTAAISTCGSVLMVFVKAHGVTCTDLAGLDSLSRTGPVLSGQAEFEPGTHA